MPGDVSQCMDIHQVQSDIQDAVESITKCIDCIRNIDEFHPSMGKDALKGSSRSARKQKKRDEQAMFFFQRLSDKLYHDRSLCGIISSSSGPSSPLMTCLCSCDFHSWCKNTIDSNYHTVENDRHKLVYEIFLPLLEKLGDSFHLLDSAIGNDDEDVKTRADEVQGEVDAGVSRFTEMKQRRSQKPKAPKGLLSLLNYTDIACLLELTICTGIVPLLEEHVQNSISERTNHLPKTLAGRLHRKSLHWGMETLQYKVEHRPLRKTDREVSIKQDRNSARARAAMKIDRAYKELSDVIITISKVVLLDRFRPMLLPRHAIDVYSALFQLERLEMIRKKFEFPICNIYRQKQSGAKRQLQRIFLHSDLNAIDSKNLYLSEKNVQFASIIPIDYRTMVLSYRSLLQSGKYAPYWLKSRLSDALTNLASSGRKGLEVIIEAFVVAVESLPAGDMTVASSRLGRALCVKNITATGRNSASRSYYHDLFSHLLEIISGSEKVNFESSSNIACILTIWSVLDNAPKDITRPFFFCRLVSDLFPCLSDDGYQSIAMHLPIRSIYSLLLLPPTGCPAVMELCLLSLSASGLDFHRDFGVDASGNVSAFGQIVRVVTSTRDNGALISNATDYATNTLGLILCTVLENWTLSEHTAEQYLAVSLLASVATSPLDVLGYSFHRCFTDNEERILLKKTSVPPTQASLMKDLEKRTLFVVNHLLVGLENGPKGSLRQMQCLVGAFFRLLLLIYFESQSLIENGRGQFLPTLIADNIDEYKILSMMILPLLCEKFSPEILLMESNPGGNGVLHIVSLIVISTSCYLGIDSNGEQSSSSYLRPNNPSCDFSRWTSVNASIGLKDPRKTNGRRNPMVKLDLESQLSITAVILSIIMTILELGSKNRIEKEEKDLKLLVPFLVQLSSLNDKPSHYTDNSTCNAIKAEIADMSVHAAALIQARSVEEITQKDTLPSNLSFFDHMNARIVELENQLSSNQPPTRAHAVVGLRKLAAQVSMKETESPSSPTGSLIIDISGGFVPEDTSQFLILLTDILRISVASLQDSESYVYLASIQTIVFIVDYNPSRLIPIIIDAIATGRLVMNLSNTGIVNNEETLSSTQRVKLVEAMNFIVWRRGSAISSYSKIIMEKIVFGRNNMSLSPSDTSTQEEIQLKSDRYFRGSDLDMVDEKSLLQELQLRLKTGGPIFDSEEIDVIRAACISLLSELVSVLHPGSVEPHCSTLVVLSMNALQLDHSRLVRRAAALLCRELYHCALREANLDDSNKSYPQSIPFILALLSSNEDASYSALKRAVSANDVDESVRGKARLFDPATIARCEEAIGIRQELEDSGVIATGELILKAQNRNQESSFVRFLSREFEGKKRNSTSLNLKLQNMEL